VLQRTVDNRRRSAAAELGIKADPRAILVIVAADPFIPDAKCVRCRRAEPRCRPPPLARS
jgi:hypothetical protein